jgi:hypothetical protein
MRLIGREVVCFQTCKLVCRVAARPLALPLIVGLFATAATTRESELMGAPVLGELCDMVQ